MTAAVHIVQICLTKKKSVKSQKNNPKHALNAKNMQSLALCLIFGGRGQTKM